MGYSRASASRAICPASIRLKRLHRGEIMFATTGRMDGVQVPSAYMDQIVTSWETGRNLILQYKVLRNEPKAYEVPPLYEVELSLMHRISPCLWTRLRQTQIQPTQQMPSEPFLQLIINEVQQLLHSDSPISFPMQFSVVRLRVLIKKLQPIVSLLLLKLMAIRYITAPAIDCSIVTDSRNS